jgi:two-component system, LuxR family, response regulator FixJ
MIVHIIDDDEAYGRTLGRVVRGAGHEAKVYPTADAFLAQLGHLPYGLIVSDIKMPGTDGLQLIQILRERHPTWPVIIITAYAEATAAVQSFRSGAVHFLQKPFRIADFLASLAEAEEVGCKRQVDEDRRLQACTLQRLSRREAQVLAALADGHQSKVIAWQLGISTRTVDMHRAKILSKLEVRNTSQAVGIFRSAAY